MPDILQGILFASCLLIASYTDMKSKTIPDIVSIIIAAAGLIHFSPAQLLGLVVVVPFLIASLCSRGGWGDTFLIGASGFLLGLTRGAVGMVFALLIFCLFYIAVRIVRKIRKQEKPPVSYPLAPFLAAGFMTAYFI